MKYPIQLIGIGSPADHDQLGWQLLENLQHSSQLQRELNEGYLLATVSDRPGLRLLNSMQGAELVFLFDAVMNSESSELVVRCEDIAIYSQPGLLSTHGFGIAETIQLGQALNKLPNKIIFYGIKIDEDQSVEKQALQQAQQRVIKELQYYLPQPQR